MASFLLFLLEVTLAAASITAALIGVAWVGGYLLYQAVTALWRPRGD